MIYQTEKQLKEYGDKVDQSIKDEIETKLKAIKDIKDCGESEKINAAIKDAEESLMKLGQAIYQAAQEASATSGTTGSNTGTNNTAETVDAEVVDE